MSPHQTDRHHFDRQIVYARPVFILLALLAMLEQPPSHALRHSVSFLIAYLIGALLVTQLERLLRKRSWHLPLVCDCSPWDISSISVLPRCRCGFRSCSF